MITLKIYGSKWEPLKEVEVEEGLRLFNAILNSGVDILNKCATKGTCGRCIIEFREGEPETHTQAEQELIYKWMRKGEIPEISSPGVRASCQLLTTNDMEFRVIYRESEHDIPRSDQPPLEQIFPEPLWKEGKPSRELPPE